MIFKDIFILSFIFISYIATLRNDNINITLPDYLTMNYIPKYGQKSNLKSNFANNEKLKIINQNKKDIVSIPEYYYNKIELPQKTLLEETKELLEVEKESLTNVLSMFKDVLLCDGKGWCNDKCCSNNKSKKSKSNIRQSPKSYRIDTVTIQPPTLLSMKRDDNNIRIKEVKCPNVCMPKCTTKCLKAYMFINNPNYPFYMNPNRYSSKSISETVPICHPYCMPKCHDSCLNDIPQNDLKSLRPLLCREACMPKCSPACVTSLPSIIPCERPLMNPKRCDCSPGYVQCSEMTCCMRYKKMAIKYRNLLPSYLDADDDINIKNLEKNDLFFAKDGLVLDNYKNGNETNTYINLLKSLWNINMDEEKEGIKNVNPQVEEGSGMNI